MAKEVGYEFAMNSMHFPVDGVAAPVPVEADSLKTAVQRLQGQMQAMLIGTARQGVINTGRPGFFLKGIDDELDVGGPGHNADFSY